MSRRCREPSTDEVESTARRTIAIHREASAGDPIRTMVASATHYDWAIRTACEWPFRYHPYLHCLVRDVVTAVLVDGRDLHDAAVNVQRAT